MSLPILTYYLTRAAAVTAFTTAQRIYSISAPQTVPSPYIVMNIVGGSDGKKLDGQEQYPVARIAVECCAQTGTEAYNIGEAVKAALLDKIKDTVLTFKDVDVVFADTDLTDYDDARTMARRILHFRVRWRNA